MYVYVDKKIITASRKGWYGRAAVLLDLAGALPCHQISPLQSEQLDGFWHMRCRWIPHNRGSDMGYNIAK
jgi:hypothetical protein